MEGLKVYKLKDIAKKENKPYSTILWQKKQNPKLFVPATIIWDRAAKQQVRYFDRETSAKLVKALKL